MENQFQDLGNASDETLQKLHQKYDLGCQKIFHKPGYMNSKGDGPYDFTCDPQHLCQNCKPKYQLVKSQIKKRNEIKAKKQHSNKRLKMFEEFKKEYYLGGHGSDCKCQNNEVCKKCVEAIQEKVLKLEGGCGAEWIQQFGGMAAGPGSVTCKDNWFLCEKCEEQLYFLNELNLEYKVEVKHLPQIQRSYWSPSSRPYYLDC